MILVAEGLFTWPMVWKTPPARLCSCGRATLATKIEPAANTKSAPTTEKMAAGKPNAQYGAEGLMSANRRDAPDVNKVPVARIR